MERIASPGATLFVTTVTSFLSAFGGSAVTVALPSIGRDLGADAITLNWIVTAFLLASAMSLIPMGRIADMVGRKRIFVLGIVVASASGLAAALATTPAQLVVIRAVQGIGGAMLFATAMAILVSVYPAAHRGRAIGINTAAVYVGLSAGPFVGGVLTHTLGWPSTFWVGALVGPVLLALVAWKLPGEWRGERDGSFDVAGSLLYAAALAALLLGFSRITSRLGIVLTAAGLLGLVVFTLVEERTRHPVLDVPLFRENRTFAFSSLAAMVSYSATFGVAFFVSLYLQSVRGLDPRAAGTAMVIQPALQAALSPLAGRMSDRHEPRVLASAGMGVTAVGLVMLVFLGELTSLVYLEAALALLGIGFALFSSPNMNAIMGSVDKRHLGVASATVATMRVIGQMLSMGLALLLVSLIVGAVQLGPTTVAAFLHAQRLAFAVFAALCGLAIFASLARGSVHARRDAGDEVPAAGREG